MPDQDALLNEAFAAWRDAREGFIAEIENIPADHFDFRPAKGVRSVREMCVHILEVAMMMVGELRKTDADFTRASFSALLEEYAGPAYALETRDELLAMLRSQLEEGIAAFRAAGQKLLFTPFPQFDGSKATRYSWFHHGIAQEMYHRGQMTLYARLLGIVPALTQMIYGDKAQ